MGVVLYAYGGRWSHLAGCNGLGGVRVTSRAQRAKRAREGPIPFPGPGSKRRAMRNHVANFIGFLGVVLLLNTVLWAGFRIMYLEREVETLGHVVDECLGVVDREVGPGYL